MVFNLLNFDHFLKTQNDFRCWDANCDYCEGNESLNNAASRDDYIVWYADA